MCGILFAVQHQGDTATDFETVWEQLELANASRGPDAQRTVRFSIRLNGSPALDVRIFASELRLRGNNPVVQPHTDSGKALCWNGEIFEGMEVEAFENDGIKLFEMIKSLRDPCPELPGILQLIEGPYAFVFFHEDSKRAYFGRDPLGRRSLLIHRPTDEKPYLIIASVSSGLSPSYDFEEVDTGKLHYADLKYWMSTDGTAVLRTLNRGHDQTQATDFSSPVRVNTNITDIPPLVSSTGVIPPTLRAPVDDLLKQLSFSVKLMVQDIPCHEDKERARVAVLFSGGIDSAVLAYLADRYIPPDEPIDLLNVAFENPRKLRIRSESNDKIPRKRKHGQGKTDPEREERRDEFNSYLVPDRITGLEELRELQRLCPHRQWNFVEVDVTFEETTKYRPIVESIMYPSRTVMDMSLGLALYFASRGVGHLQSEDDSKIPYTSRARVLLNGLGADELLGGYARHRTTYTSGGWRAVVEELQLEIERIPTRNLGRDDRIISSHGKEARHPFLSLSVVNSLARLPIHYKMDPRLPLGLGDKILLRLAAQKVGLELASSRKKRAMQFGSHSARMEAGQCERRGGIILSQ